MDSEKPVLLICGLGRCGLSLTMQMLDAGGVPCFGEFPAYETDHLGIGAPLTEKFMNERRGQAVKLLDPHRSMISRSVPFVFIWLDRDAKEQTKSQLKLVQHALGGRHTFSDVNQKAWAESLTRDRNEALLYSLGKNTPRLFVAFELLLSHSQSEARRISGWLAEHGIQMDPLKAAKAVIPRGPKCLPNLDIEIGLIERGENKKKEG